MPSLALFVRVRHGRPASGTDASAQPRFGGPLGHLNLQEARLSSAYRGRLQQAGPILSVWSSDFGFSLSQVPDSPGATSELFILFIHALLDLGAAPRIETHAVLFVQTQWRQTGRRASASRNCQLHQSLQCSSQTARSLARMREEGWAAGGALARLRRPGLRERFRSFSSQGPGRVRISRTTRGGFTDVDGSLLLSGSHEGIGVLALSQS